MKGREKQVREGGREARRVGINRGRREHGELAVRTESQQVQIQQYLWRPRWTRHKGKIQ